MQLRNVLVAVVLAADAVSAQTPKDSHAVQPKEPSGDHVGYAYDRAGHADVSTTQSSSSTTSTQSSSSVASTQSSSTTSTQSSSTTSTLLATTAAASATTVTVTVTADPQTVTQSVCPNVTYMQPQGPNGTAPPYTPVNIVVSGASGVVASALGMLAAVAGAVYVGL